MSFAYPWLALLGVVLALTLAIAYAGAERARDAQTLLYSNLQFFTQAARLRTWPVTALRIMWFSGLACCALALGGPRLVLPVPVRDGTAFICIDTSGSMASTDVAPTRAQAALEAARAFIDEAAPGTRIGIIAFATNAQVVQPPTADKATARNALAEVPSPNGATAIGDALALAAQGLPPSGHRVVILITDGVNNAGTDPQEVAAYLGAHHVPIYTIGIGTRSGDIIGGAEATIDEGALRAYAQASGGAYARAQDARQLRAALERLGRVTSFERKPVAAATGFWGAGAALWAAAMLFGLRRGRIP